MESFRYAVKLDKYSVHNERRTWRRRTTVFMPRKWFFLRTRRRTHTLEWKDILFTQCAQCDGVPQNRKSARVNQKRSSCCFGISKLEQWQRRKSQKWQTERIGWRTEHFSMTCVCLCLLCIFMKRPCEILTKNYFLENVRYHMNLWIYTCIAESFSFSRMWYSLHLFFFLCGYNTFHWLFLRRKEIFSHARF